jgi:hypothetical protein
MLAERIFSIAFLTLLASVSLSEADSDATRPG